MAKQVLPTEESPRNITYRIVELITPSLAKLTLKVKLFNPLSREYAPLPAVLVLLVGSSVW